MHAKCRRLIKNKQEHGCLYNNWSGIKVFEIYTSRFYTDMQMLQLNIDKEKYNNYWV